MKKNDVTGSRLTVSVYQAAEKKAEKRSGKMIDWKVVLNGCHQNRLRLVSGALWRNVSAKELEAVALMS